MAGLARSIKSNTVRVIKVNNKAEFIKNFNSKVPSKDFLEKCSDDAKKARERK